MKDLCIPQHTASIPTTEETPATCRYAFDRAIRHGRLSADVNAPNYAGNYMFMGKARDGRTDAFKHISTRQYLPV